MSVPALLFAAWLLLTLAEPPCSASSSPSCPLPPPGSGTDPAARAEGAPHRPHTCPAHSTGRLATDPQGWVTGWEKGLLWFSSNSSWFAHLLIPDRLGFSPTSWVLPTLVCIPPLLPKQILITYWRASPMYFQLCQGALEPLCSPAGDACCFYPALLLARASRFEGKRCAAWCDPVPRRSIVSLIKDRRRIRATTSEQEPQAPPALDGAGLAAFR